MLTTSYTVAINPHSEQTDYSVLFAGRSQTEPLHTVGPQVLDYFLIHYVVSGEGTFHSHGKTYSLQAGSSFFIFPGDLVSYVASEQHPWKYRWVALQGENVSQILREVGITPEYPVYHAAQPSPRLRTLFAKILEVLRKKDAAVHFESKGYLYILLSEYANIFKQSQRIALKPKSHLHEQMEQAIRWLTLQHSQPVTIHELADSLGYHRTYLSKKFKEYTGVSPQQFLLRIRMERAVALLQKSLTIKEVASSVGFNDALYFSKQFKNWYGIAPSEYRKQHDLTIQKNIP